MGDRRVLVNWKLFLFVRVNGYVFNVWLDFVVIGVYGDRGFDI